MVLRQQFQNGESLVICQRQFRQKWEVIILILLATQDAKQKGFDEAILLDQSGNVSEAPGENIFLVKNNKLITPTLSASALDGITQNSIITLAKDMNLEVKVRKVSKKELKFADEIFLSGTAAEITPIIKLDKKKIGDGKVGKITKSLMTVLRRHCNEQKQEIFSMANCGVLVESCSDRYWGLG